MGQSRWWRGNQRYPVRCDNPTQVLERGLIPARLLRPDGEGEAECGTWMRDATAGDVERLLELQPLIHGLRARVAAFNLPYLALPVESSALVTVSPGSGRRSTFNTKSWFIEPSTKTSVKRHPS